MENALLSFKRIPHHRSVEGVRHIPIKRIFDVIFSLFVLFLLSPLFFAIAIAIKLSSGGKVIYVQTRLGRGGKIFKCFKFRTMYPNAQIELPNLLAKNPYLKKEWQIHQKLREDPRIFPMGKWLRRYSLDELPQFWNVIKGDLSVVGPRPYMVSQKRQMGHLASTILSVRPGITGLWQTSGRNRTTFEKRIALDAEYTNNHSLWLDLKLILKTIPQLFLFTDAY